MCAMVADTIGPERILAKKGGGSDRMAAAGVIASGIIVDPPRTATISVTFQHPDREIVQPVLNALIKAYAIKHRQVHSGEGVWDDYYVEQRDEWSNKLAQTEAELHHLKSAAKLVSLDEAKSSQQKQLGKLQEKLFDAQTALAECKAQMGDADSAALKLSETNVSTTAMPPVAIADYTAITTRLAYLTTYEKKLELEGLKEAHPLMQATRTEIAERTKQKTVLDQKYPLLAGFVTEPLTGTTNGVGSSISDLRRLTTTVEVLENLLSNAQFQATQIMELEPKIVELQRQRDLQESSYKFYSSRLEVARAGESAGEGQMINMAVVQSPSPPSLDTKKTLKFVGAALGGCIGLGLGFAFLIDFVLDRTIKRSTDVKRRLHLPVMLTIPHTMWSGGWLPGWVARRRNIKIQRYDPNLNGSMLPSESGMTPWNPSHHLRHYTDGLRERIITYFEVNQLTHQPKLVAVTSCGGSAGVTTLATGLAASLSLTGEGNVLLVDMNIGEGASHSFHKGKPGCGLSETSEAGESANDAYPNNYLASVSADGNPPDQFSTTLPRVFNDVMPKLKVSGYDYIVFDLPPVSQTSMTPRLSGHMDMVLLVLESEKTSWHLAAESSELMRGARANVAAILNKCRSHVPTAISTGY